MRLSARFVPVTGLFDFQNPASFEPRRTGPSPCPTIFRGEDSADDCEGASLRAGPSIRALPIPLGAVREKEQKRSQKAILREIAFCLGSAT